MDVELPTAGNVPASSNGLSYVTGSATYLGVPVQTQVLTFDASGHVVGRHYPPCTVWRPATQVSSQSLTPFTALCLSASKALTVAQRAAI